MLLRCNKQPISFLNQCHYLVKRRKGGEEPVQAGENPHKWAHITSNLIPRLEFCFMTSESNYVIDLYTSRNIRFGFD
jgi:hypothetical protein